MWLYTIYRSFYFIGGRYGNTAKEEEQFLDFLSLIEMLINMLSKDYIDFAANTSGQLGLCS